MRKSLLAASLGILLVGCPKDDPKPGTSGGAASAANTPPSASAVAAAANAETNKPSTPVTTTNSGGDEGGLAPTIDFSGEDACIPKGANGTDPVSPTATASGKDGLAFCLGKDKKADQGCFALELATGKFKKLPKKDPVIPTRKVSASGSHLVEALDKSIRVCGRSIGSDCNTITVGAYRAHSKVPADVSPDGKKLVVVRETGSETVGLEIYDVATGAREKQSGIKDKGGIVGDVSWLGKRIMVVTCVEAGPGCNAALFDPETQKSTSPGVNVYGVERPAHRANGPLWAFVDSTGGQVALVDVDTGTKKPNVRAPLVSEVTSGVAVIPRDTGIVAIVAGSPQAGTVAVVDLSQGGKLVKKYSPPACK